MLLTGARAIIIVPEAISDEWERHAFVSPQSASSLNVSS